VKFYTGPQANIEVAAWVAQRIPFVGTAGFGTSGFEVTCVGVIGKDNKPLCGVVFHDYQPEFGTIAFSTAAESPRWATRNVIRQILAYPFDELQVQKLWSATPATNERALRVVKGIGFTQEATLARHFGKYGHAIISRMFKRDYERLYGVPSGKT
jgi:RimJ/RimL family protein N-acetyltransferase